MTRKKSAYVQYIRKFYISVHCWLSVDVEPTDRKSHCALCLPDIVELALGGAGVLGPFGQEHQRMWKGSGFWKRLRKLFHILMGDDGGKGGGTQRRKVGKSRMCWGMMNGWGRGNQISGARCKQESRLGSDHRGPGMTGMAIQPNSVERTNRQRLLNQGATGSGSAARKRMKLEW